MFTVNVCVCVCVRACVHANICARVRVCQANVINSKIAYSCQDDETKCRCFPLPAYFLQLFFQPSTLQVMMFQQSSTATSIKLLGDGVGSVCV